MQAGALIADGKIRLGRKWLLLIAVASGVLLFFESKFVRGLVGGRDCECYVFLIPLAISLFLLIKDVDISLKCAPTFNLLALLLIKLENRPHFKWLRYSH